MSDRCECEKIYPLVFVLGSKRGLFQYNGKIRFLRLGTNNNVEGTYNKYRFS